ncbi:MAG TPA: four helix bundle protein [Candidatus Binatia bacterium]|nr:four helix bundle protein [Candidatus Binatia bacterium]
MTLLTYRVTVAFPKGEMWGLTIQLRRATASIGANIAEGSGRRWDGEVCRFLQIARGSANEAEYHLLLAHDLHLLDDKDFRILTRRTDEPQRMLTALIQRARSARSMAGLLVARSWQLSSGNLFPA